jgi:hypothetical protein
MLDCTIVVLGLVECRFKLTKQYKMTNKAIQ